MPAARWCAKIAGSVFRAAITARAARWLRRSPRRSPTDSKSRKRCAMRRNTPGRRSPEASAPASASSSRTAFSGRARAQAGSEAARPVRHHPRSGGEHRAVRDVASRARGRRRARAIPQEEARRSGGKGGRAPCQTPRRADHRERRYRARAGGECRRGSPGARRRRFARRARQAGGQDPRGVVLRPPGACPSRRRDGRRLRGLWQRVRVAHQAWSGTRTAFPLHQGEESRRAAGCDRRNYARERAAAHQRRRRPAGGHFRSLRGARYQSARPPIRETVHMKSESLFERAQRVIPGGVNSPVRAFRAVGGVPLFFERASGAYLWDADRRRYIDYLGSWGPMVAGHSHPAVIEAVQEAASRALSFGAPTEAEVELAETLCRLVPSLDQVRLVSSGTEATMTAIRLARGFTGRSLIVKFEGCYHGHADALLVKAGSGALTYGHPSSAGVPAETAAQTMVMNYNDSSGLKALFREKGEQIAALIVEPVAGNMNLVLPAPGFLEGLREQCTRSGAVLIFDEVMTGFRVALGGAQARYGIRPDLTTLGKVIGGGLPVGAVGGRRDIMQKIAPLGPVYQAGTLSGNPLAVAAGLATLKLVDQPGFQHRIESITQQLVTGLAAEARKAGVIFSAQSIGSMFGIYFRDAPPRSFAEVMQCDRERFNRFFHAMLDQGVHVVPSAYETGFVSAAHDGPEIDATLVAARNCFERLA